MGQLKQSIEQAEFLQAATQLGDIRQRMRRIGGEILSLAAAYKGVISLVTDADDQAELDTRKAEAIASVKSDFSSADAATKAIINSVLTELLTE